MVIMNMMLMILLTELWWGKAQYIKPHQGKSERLDERVIGSSLLILDLKEGKF